MLPQSPRFIFYFVFYLLRFLPNNLVFITVELIKPNCFFVLFPGLCLTNDVDTLLYHMNNARYLREVDFARVDFYERTLLWRTILSKGGSVVQGATTIRYRRFIRPFTRFTISSRVSYSWSMITYANKNCFFSFYQYRSYTGTISQFSWSTDSSVVRMALSTVSRCADNGSFSVPSRTSWRRCWSPSRPRLVRPSVWKSSRMASKVVEMLRLLPLASNMLQNWNRKYPRKWPSGLNGTTFLVLAYAVDVDQILLTHR